MAYITMIKSHEVMTKDCKTGAALNLSKEVAL